MSQNSIVITNVECLYHNGHLTVNLTSEKAVKTATINIHGIDESNITTLRVTNESVELDSVMDIFNHYNSLSCSGIPKSRSMSDSASKNIKKAISALKKTIKSDKAFYESFGILDEVSAAKYAGTTYNAIMEAHNKPSNQFFWGYGWNVSDFYAVGNKPRFTRFLPGGDMHQSFEEYKKKTGHIDHNILSSRGMELDEEDTNILKRFK